MFALVITMLCSAKINIKFCSKTEMVWPLVVVQYTLHMHLSCYFTIYQKKT
jgi:hypothetical protein